MEIGVTDTRISEQRALYVLVSFAAGLIWYAAFLLPISAASFLFNDIGPAFLQRTLMAVALAISTLLVSLLFKSWISRPHRWSGWIGGTIVFVFLVALVCGVLFIGIFFWAIGKPETSDGSYILRIITLLPYLLGVDLGVAGMSLHIALPLAGAQIWVLRKTVLSSQPSQL
jgi:hypothetical protein